MSSFLVPHRLLVATDGSPPAKLATKVAANIAAAQDVELMVVEVVAPTQHRLARMAPPVPITRRLDDPLVSPVLAEARRLCFEEGMAISPVLLSGDPSLAVVALARSASADLLVIGSAPARWSALRRGRFARRVQLRAPCPVLMVQPAPVTSVPWLRRRIPATIVRLVPNTSTSAVCPCCSDGGCRCCGVPPLAA